MDSSDDISADLTLAHSEPTDLEPVSSAGEIEKEYSRAAPLVAPSLAHTEPTDVETITIPAGAESASES